MNEYKVTVYNFAKDEIISTRYCLGIANARKIAKQFNTKLHYCANAEEFWGAVYPYEIFVKRSN